MDEWLTLFKGELTITDIRDMVFRRLVELRQARVNRLLKEKDAEEKRMQNQQNEMTRNRILAK